VGKNARRLTIWRSWYRASLICSFKFNQQDATLYNNLYCCQCSTRFRRFFCPSSGAQSYTHSIWYMSSLLAATASGLIRRTFYACAQFSRCSSTTNARSETAQMAVCCQNLPPGALSSRSSPSLLVGELFKKFDLFFEHGCMMSRPYTVKHMWQLKGYITGSCMYMMCYHHWLLHLYQFQNFQLRHSYCVHCLLSRMSWWDIV
jgi:hypothetical protein